MRVLALTNLYPSPDRPHRATFNRQQFAALAAHHEVQVIAPIAWTDELATRRRPRRANAPLSPRDHRSSPAKAGCITVHHPRYLFTPKVLRAQYGHFLVRSVRRCFHESVATFRPDVVLGCWAYPDGWAAVRLAREAGLPVAVKVHGSDLLTVADHPARRRPTAAALAGADAVIAVSRHLAAQAVALGADPNRVHVVTNGVDRAVFHPAPRDAARSHLGITAADPLLLFVGNLVPVKGPDILLDALATLARDGLPFQCALVGSGPLKSELQARIASLGLAQRIKLIGARPLGELPHWYRAADLLVLPSRSEGIPNVLLEAGACGTPFIATRVGGIPEIAPPDRLIPPGDAPALAEHIKTFLASQAHAPSHAPSPGYTPRSWDDSAHALAAVLQTITSRRPTLRSAAA